MTLPNKPESVAAAQEKVKSGVYGADSIEFFNLSEAQQKLASGGYGEQGPSVTMDVYPNGYNPRDTSNAVSKTFTVDNVDEIPNGEYWLMNNKEWVWVDRFQNLRKFFNEAKSEVVGGTKATAQAWQRSGSGSEQNRPGTAGRGKTILTGGTGVREEAKLKRQNLG